MIVARTAQEVRGTARGAVTLVPTMGALHAGHVSLIRLAAAHGDPVVVSVFVNPTQFGPAEDFATYPRDLDADAAVAADAGATVLFAPSADEVYPAGFATTVDPGPLGRELCGASRPGHFAGVATVVTRLFGLVAPSRAVFGAKDRQQLVLVEQVTRDLALGVELVAAPTVREADGLALSSRNLGLDAASRAAAAAVPAALRTVAARYAAGERDPEALLADPPRGLDVEYLELRSAELHAYDPDRPAAALIAAHVGGIRLIDNVLLDPSAPAAALHELRQEETR